jgi:hypothetical protein
MASATPSAYGLASYVDAAGQIAARARTNQPLTLLRMLAAKAAYDIAGQPVDLADFTARLYADMQRDDYLVQEFVRPHPQMARLGSGKALGTLRILSWLQGGKVQILYALSRIPCGNNPHDNFSGGSTGNLIANVDTVTGRLGAAYGRRDVSYPRLLERFASNPDIIGVQVSSGCGARQVLRPLYG